MTVKKFEPLSSGLCKITPDYGPVFYLRKQYLSSVDFECVYAGAEFDDDQTSELLDAGFAAVVEIKAISYLARCEQCRFNLTNKLVQKGYEKNKINQALDFLESEGLLSDERFSRAWLNGRKSHYEGRIKLAAELANRGINRDVSKKVLDEFFEENDEYEICKKALEKALTKRKSDEKLIAALQNAGFTYKMIKSALSEVQKN